MVLHEVAGEAAVVHTGFPRSRELGLVLTALHDSGSCNIQYDSISLVVVKVRLQVKRSGDGSNRVQRE